MAKSRSDVELVISAENKAQATLEEFQKAISDLDKAQKTLSTSMGGTGASADDLKRRIAQLNIVQNELSSRAKAISAYREQADAMRKVGREMFKYKEAVRNTKAQIEATTKPSKELKQVFTEQSAQLAKLKREYDRLHVGLRRTKGALRENKIAIKDLDAAESKLKTTQQNVTRAIARQTTALENVSTSSRKAGKGIRQYGNDTRKSLGYVQRLRGETLSLVASFGGLYAAGRGIASVFEISRKMSAAKARLGVAFGGDDGAISAEIARVASEADRLGVNFETLIDEYTKFVPSAKRTGMTLKESRHIFDAVSESAVVNRASMADLGGIYKAVTQIISKGKLQAEELRGQIGDRLVGAVIDYADGMKVSTEELSRMLEQGELTSSTLINFGNRLKEVYGDELAEAVEQPVSQLARLQNAITQIKIVIGDSGFIEELANGMKAVAAELKDPATIEGAATLGRGLGEVVKVLVKLVQNMDKVISVFKVLIAFKLGGTIAKIGGSAIAATSGINTLSGALLLLGKRALFLAGPAGIIAGLGLLLYDLV
ncbi:MAG: hypothetical protein DRQ98_11120 [Gammaproteobacteria bacterium]|nr:MAG: hypothetical protein DRQ98_11120 [Gammaproteobacteria bacterium]